MHGAVCDGFKEAFHSEGVSPLRQRLLSVECASDDASDRSMREGRRKGIGRANERVIGSFQLNYGKLCSTWIVNLQKILHKILLDRTSEGWESILESGRGPF